MLTTALSPSELRIAHALIAERMTRESPTSADRVLTVTLDRVDYLTGQMEQLSETHVPGLPTPSTPEEAVEVFERLEREISTLVDENESAAVPDAQLFHLREAFVGYFLTFAARYSYDLEERHKTVMLPAHLAKAAVAYDKFINEVTYLDLLRSSKYPLTSDERGDVEELETAICVIERNAIEEIVNALQYEIQSASANR